MHRQTQGQEGCGATNGYGGTDWHALEVQLDRTRTILQDILVHLQEVLRNLKMARHGGRGSASTAEAGGQDGRSRAQAAGHGARGQRVHQPGPAGQAAGANGAGGRAQATGGNGAAGRTHAAGGSDWFRARNRQGFDARAEAGSNRSSRNTTGPEAATDGGRFRSATGDQARTGESRSFRSGPSFSRSQAASGQAGRERPRTESTFRAGAAGAEREARQGAPGGPSAAGGARTHARTASRAAGFRLDHDRQARARQMARRSGMNLKCAYDILCLDYPCTVDELKIAYRHMARLYHPDLGGDEEAMKDVNVAYELAMRFCAGPRRASTAWAV